MKKRSFDIASDLEVRIIHSLVLDIETVNDGSFTSKFPAPSGDRSAGVGYWYLAPGTNLPGDVNNLSKIIRKPDTLWQPKPWRRLRIPDTDRWATLHPTSFLPINCGLTPVFAACEQPSPSLRLPKKNSDLC